MSDNLIVREIGGRKIALDLDSGMFQALDPVMPLAHIRDFTEGTPMRLGSVECAGGARSGIDLDTALSCDR